VTKKDGKLVVSFKHTEKGLVAQDVDLDRTHLPSRTLKGFTICGTDGRLVKAYAKIEDTQVIVSSPETSAPTGVRYA
jgi:hypothetical protein